jgi:NAD(P)H-hydrate epimerase
MKQLPSLTIPLPTPEEMRRWDEAASEHFGIPPLLLMENAAQAALQELKRHVILQPETKVLIYAGKGNNGGDGAALARLLHEEGCTVLVCAFAASAHIQGHMQGAASQHMAVARSLGIQFLEAFSDKNPALPAEWQTPHIIIDAIVGTGLQGDLRPQELTHILTINRYRERTFVFSLDIPSGLCGLTGKARPDAVRAHVTLCFEAGKPGLFFPEAAEYAGHIAVRRVGIPLVVRTMIAPSWELLAPEKGTWPLPSPFRHKGEAGKVLIIGGSEGMDGAPFLAALGSLRAGAGLVHVAHPGGLPCPDVFPEILKHPVGTGSRWEQKNITELERIANTILPDAVVIGPGMGRSLAVQHIVKVLLEKKTRPPIIIDADALYCFRSPHVEPESSENVAAPLPVTLLGSADILTPHPGEMARLTPAPAMMAEAGQHSRALLVQNNRPGALAAFTDICAAIMVLKGPGTLIGKKGAATVLCPTAVPTLAVGGSGDVLAGMCGALAAVGMDSFDAAKLAVYLHARAGELLAQKAPLGHLARDIADAVPLAWKELCKHSA